MADLLVVMMASRQAEQMVSDWAVLMVEMKDGKLADS